MRTKEVEREEWRPFFDSFSRQHEDWLANVEVIGEELGAQIEASNVPFDGITADVKGSEPNSIAILLRQVPGGRLAHIVPDVLHVRVEQNDEGVDEALQIESSDGTMTLLRFRSVMPAEAVDGVPGR